MSKKKPRKKTNSPAKTTTRTRTAPRAKKARVAPTPEVAAASGPEPTVVAEPPTVTAAERQRMIEEAAYFLAEARGFTPADPGADWERAESDIDALLEREGAVASAC